MRPEFVLDAVLTSEPDRLAVGVGLGPRVLISQQALDATGLVQPGSLVRWTTRVIMGGPSGAPDEAHVQGLLAAAARTFPQAGWETRSRLNVSPDFTRDLDRFAEFLTLSGLLSLVVGGVGVANAAQGFVERKRASLAILKAIGATGTSVVMLALVEFLIVALVGARPAPRSASAIPFVVNWLFADLLPIPLAPSVDLGVIVLGLAYGLLTALAFSIAPLGRAHDLPVTTLIRDLAEEREGWPRARYLRRRCGRRRRACRAGDRHQPAAVGRDGRRRRDARRIPRAQIGCVRHCFRRAARSGFAPGRACAWRWPRSTGRAR